MISAVLPYRNNFNMCKTRNLSKENNVSFSGAAIHNAPLTNKIRIFEYAQNITEELKTNPEHSGARFKELFNVVENFINNILSKEGAVNIENLPKNKIIKNGKQLIKDGSKVKFVTQSTPPKTIAALDFSQDRQAFFLDITPKKCNLIGARNAKGDVYIKLQPKS